MTEIWERYDRSESQYFHRPGRDFRRVHRLSAPVVNPPARESWRDDLARHLKRCPIVTEVDHLLAEIRAAVQKAGNSVEDEAYFAQMDDALMNVSALDRHLVAGGELPQAWGISYDD